MELVEVMELVHLVELVEVMEVMKLVQLVEVMEMMEVLQLVEVMEVGDLVWGWWICWRCHGGNPIQQLWSLHH